MAGVIVKAILAIVMAIGAVSATAADAKVPSPAKPIKLSRLALVIGNAAYKEDRLTNLVNDAKDVVALLERSSFAVVPNEVCNPRRISSDGS